MASEYSTLIETAAAWAAHDPDPVTAKAVSDLVEKAKAEGESSAAGAELAQRFSGPLTFGTAGLRGEVGPGQHNMNRSVVIRATKGLVDWLNSQIDTPVVVIGCDARYGSHEFAHDAAAVVVAAGGRALLLPEQLPTPVTAFAVRHLKADAGIMVTASHNPPQDNGYKVYLGGRIATDAGEGVQLISPSDQQIQDAIAAAPVADEIARDASGVVAADVRDAYFARAEELGRMGPSANDKQALRMVLTPMHGVGGATCVKALHRAGYDNVHLVTQQAFPDPDFPTVSFPNPEEPGALDLAMSLAETINADVIVALDPDADRCAVAVPNPTAATDGRGPWVQLSGDETGSLLGDWVLSRTDKGGCANSIVSSRMLGAIAKAHGRDHQATLTGFKWIARTPGIAFGYEEAIGFCCDPNFVRDKDGITTAITVANYAATLKRDGKTFPDELARLRKEHGFYATAPLTFRVEDLSLISDAMTRLLRTPPASLAGSKVVETANLSDGYQGLPPTTGLLLLTEDHDRVIIRPSGTEPKLKCYLEVIIDTAQADDPQATATKRLEEIKQDLHQAIGM